MARLIDKLPDKKDGREMQVLVLGMPRTGSISIRTALGQLGYKSFHGGILHETPELYPAWEEALRAKYFNEGQKFGRREFDKLLGNFDATCNLPGAMLAEELVKAYPNAKVVLTTRDVDKWQASMKTTVDATFGWKAFEWLAPFDPVWGPWWRYHKLEHAVRPLISPNGERQGYLDHYANMRSIVEPERLLEYRVGEGWDRLCAFLGKEIPNHPFPHVNDKGQFIVGRKQRLWHAFGCMLVRVVPFTVLALGAVVLGWRKVGRWM
ncbi:P-loop containing nucleoside triphosphate hydrolase protein [Hypoxylon argillaceum]|nr:P-loop containing nucleoside triphosphate hydrolase protein [Hypoxylon argillaceum]KAI1144830.1 P-loop containing nucleoside triphosphate hydrolase protein [Nemania diffusa]